MRRSYRQFLPLLSLLATPGCCTVAQWLCGVDDSEWIQAGFETPDRAVQTFQEAIRREHEPILAQCLSEGFKRSSQITGEFNVAIVLGKLREQGLPPHLLGYAEQESREVLPDGAVRVVFELQGERLRVTFRPQDYWEVLLADPANPDDTWSGGSNRASRRRLVRLDQDEETGGWKGSMRIPEFEPGRDELSPNDVVRVATGIEWKVDGLEFSSSGNDWVGLVVSTGM